MKGLRKQILFFADNNKPRPFRDARNRTKQNKADKRIFSAMRGAEQGKTEPKQNKKFFAVCRDKKTRIAHHTAGDVGRFCHFGRQMAGINVWYNL
ncbi:MAG: hypothetical protein RR522_01945 [Alistipes sp.]